MFISSFTFAPTKAPSIEMKSAYTVSTGNISVVAIMRVAARYLNGLVPDTSIASICSVTFIDPSSALIPEPIFPAQISAVTSGPISRTMEMADIAGRNEPAPNSTIVGRDCRMSTKPSINAVAPTRTRDLSPSS